MTIKMLSFSVFLGILILMILFASLGIFNKDNTTIIKKESKVFEPDTISTKAQEKPLAPVEEFGALKLTE